MTVEEIKDYIQESIDIHFEMGEDKREKQLHRAFVGELRIICNKLDELEQPIEIDIEKYFEQIDKLIDKEMA